MVPQRVGGQDGRVEPVEIRTDELILRPSPVAAYCDPEVIRWYGVPASVTHADSRRLRRRDCWIGPIESDEVAK